MAQAGILLPPGPLFIVDKSWTLPNSTKYDRTKSLDLYSGKNIKAYQAAHPATQKPQTAPPLRAKGPSRFHFIVANEPDGRHDQNARAIVRRRARQYAIRTRPESIKSRDDDSHGKDSPQAPDDVVAESNEPAANSTQGTPILAVIPRSSSCLYGNDHARGFTGLESYLHYYRNVIAVHAYPLGNRLSFEFNPIRGTCFPLALNDRLFLQTIILISTIHHSFVGGAVDSKLASDLASRVFKELRDRIAQKDVSDATLLSVSCLALIEHTIGHHDQWRVHALGMSEMLRLRGGIHNVDMSIKWKIYRADLVGAVDHVSRPMLSHPGIRTNLKDLRLTSGGPQNKLIVALASGGMSDVLQSIFRHIYYATQVVRRSIISGATLSAYFYDNSWMQIQHDLLETATTNPLDDSWRIAGLIFVNTFIKSRPFLGANCIVISQKMHSSLRQALRMITNKHQHLWLAFIGGLISMETTDHGWFVQTLAHIVRACDYATWNEVKRTLEQYLWLDSLHDQAGLKVWEKVSIAMSQVPYNLE